MKSNFHIWIKSAETIDEHKKCQNSQASNLLGQIHIFPATWRHYDTLKPDENGLLPSLNENHFLNKSFMLFFRRIFFSRSHFMTTRFKENETKLTSCEAIFGSAEISSMTINWRVWKCKSKKIGSFWVEKSKSFQLMNIRKLWVKKSESFDDKKTKVYNISS